MEISNRRMDAIYFLAFLGVVLVGVFMAARPSDEVANTALPDFSLPGIELPVPFELPYGFVRFTRGEAPKLKLSENTESVIVEVREALLESAAPVAVGVETEHLAGLSAPPVYEVNTTP